MDGGAASRPAGGEESQAGRIGPNAITRFAEALEASCGAAMKARVIAQAGLTHHLHSPPEAMVAEGDVVALHRAARALLPPEVFEAVARDAGERTARYLLAHRIPRAVQRLLRLLPPALAARVLAGAIARHAWTFVGSGRFRIDRGPPLAFVIADGPLGCGLHTTAPACGYLAATFEGLFRELIHPEARVAERACQAAGTPACVFTATWPAGLTRRRRADRGATSRARERAAPQPVR
ncbi:MAG: bacteriochlorophyll 4-vinyl reductase [Elioraea sp.]|nr:bacteriochlorophyll 4-vinyl reductase [Elioraea sp.]